MKLSAKFASMSVEELWEIYEEISKLLEAKMLAEKEVLERRLIIARRYRSKGPTSSPSTGRSRVHKSG